MTRTRRLSTAALKILDSLSRAPDGLHGYALMKHTQLASGTLYPILMRFADRGWLEKAWDMEGVESGPPRRIYTLTDKGRTALKASAAKAARPLGNIKGTTA